MGKNTPNKRKSSTIANATPIKFPKLSGTPVSNKINNKSPKLANKVNQKQINGNKSPNKNQKNGKQITPQGRRKTKQIEEDESDDESDDSMDEQNGNSDNSHDATDEEVDSDEEAEVAEEADSDEEADVAEEADNSDEEAEIKEETDNTDEEADSAEVLEEQDEEDNDADEAKNNKASELPNNKCLNSDCRLFVKGLKPNDRIPEIFGNCSIAEYKLIRDPVTNKPTGQAFICFRDEDSLKKALEKNGKESLGLVLKVKPTRNEKKLKKRTEFTAFIKNLNLNTKLEDVFKDCKIHTYRILRDPVTNNITGMAYVHFEDEENLQKALLKNETEYDGNVIIVYRKSCSIYFEGLYKVSNVEDVFKNCKIQRIDMFKIKSVNQFTGSGSINFKDTESFEKALSKNNTEFEGKTIKVKVFHFKPNMNSRHTRNYLKPVRNSGHTRSYVEPVRNSNNPGNKVAILKKQLLAELRAEAAQLERQIYGNSKPNFQKKKHL